MIRKADIYVSEILSLQDALLFMILSNKTPLRPQTTSFSFPGGFVGQSSRTDSSKASACPEYCGAERVRGAVVYALAGANG